MSDDHDLLITISADVKNIRGGIDEIKRNDEAQWKRIDEIRVEQAVHASKIHDLRTTFWKSFWGGLGLILGSGGLFWYFLDKAMR